MKIDVKLTAVSGKEKALKMIEINEEEAGGTDIYSSWATNTNRPPCGIYHNYLSRQVTPF